MVEERRRERPDIIFGRDEACFRRFVAQTSGSISQMMLLWSSVFARSTTRLTAYNASLQVVLFPVGDMNR